MKKLLLIVSAITLLAVSCSEDYLETTPTNQISDQSVFTTAQGAQTVIDGTIRYMREFIDNHDQFGVKSIDLAQDLMGEDIAPTRHHWFGFDYRNDNRNATYRRPTYAWRLYYRIIYNMNGVVNNIDEASADSEAQKENLKAQALTLRGYAYFQLIQLFQHTYIGHQNDLGVPIYLEATVEGKPRESVSAVYDQIVSDLDQAIQLFESSDLPQRHISDPTGNIAKGIRARVALVMNNWAVAEEMAAEAREGYDLMDRDEFQQGFDSYAQQNWMWGLEINDEQSTIYASWFSHMDMTIGGYAGLGYSPKQVGLKLYQQMDTTDIRYQLIVPSSSGRLYNYKFAAAGDKEFAADYVMMRPEEMLLIEAEAHARQGETDAAQALLEELYAVRYEEAPEVTATGDALLQKILLERRIELWGEGFRGYDIKRLKIGVDRTGSNHDQVVAIKMTMAPEDRYMIYQIPQAEIDANDAIGEDQQNP